MRYLIIMIIFTCPLMAKNDKTIKSLLAKSVSNSTISTNKAIAQINGLPISKKEFLRILYASSGMRVLRQFIGLKLAEDLANQKGIVLTDADFEKELIRIVSSLGPKKDASGRELTYDDRLRILNVILKQKGLSYDEFLIGVKRQAYFKAIARKNMKITKKMLQREYQKAYGPKVNIRAIVVTSLKLAQKLYEELQNRGNFEQFARQYSILPSGPLSGGLIENVSQYDPRLPALVVECALKLSSGKISSPIRVDDRVWIIKIEKQIPVSKVKYEKVKAELLKKVRNELEMQIAQQLEIELLKKANIKIYDKQLAKDFDNWRAQISKNEMGK